MTAPRLRLVFVLLALVLVVPGALLVRRALASVALEREARERAVAERAFDEMERALTQLLRAEEERPASDYDFASPASPLHERPAGALVAGYFQIEADGTVTTPAWGKGVRTLAEAVVGEVPRAAPAPAALAPARLPAPPLPAESPPAPAAEPTREGALPEPKPEAAPAPEPPPATGALAEAPREQVITVAQGARVEIDEVAVDPELPNLYEEGDEGAGDAYDALAKLNTGAKERQDRKQRSYVQEQIALPDGSARVSRASAPEAANTAPDSSRAAAEEIVARALGAPETASEWSASKVEGADVGATAAKPVDAADAPPPAEQLASARGAAADERVEDDARNEGDRSAETRGAGEAAGRAELARERDDAAGPAQQPAAAERVVPEAPAPIPAKRRALRDEAPAARAELVRVIVDPMRGRLAAGDVYLLVRNARIGDRALRQGLAIERAALERLLTSATLAEGALPAASVVLTPAHASARPVSTPERRAFSHRFAEPFHALAAELAFAPFADEGARSVYWLVALFTVSAGVGLFAVYRMTAVALHFAERRSNFAAAVSHELKTPLTAIRLYAEMLRDGLVPSEEKRREYYGSITGETERLSRLINNVLEFSRLERGARTFELRIGDVAPVVREAVDLLRGHAAQHGFALELVADDALPPVRFERDALVQVVFNLVDNAVKYGRGESARIEVSCRRAGEGVAIGVRDHGAGVPREELGRILEPFYRRGDELTRSAQGAGIGLALVRALVQEMGGALRVVNADGGGLAVTLELSGTASGAAV